MIICNKCGYDKAVQGLNEIWCDKCDVTKHGPSPKSFPPIRASVVLDGNAENPVKYVDEVGKPYQPSEWDWQLPDGRVMSGTSFVYPVTYHSNALPSQPFEEAMGDCGITTTWLYDNQHAEHIRLHQQLCAENLRARIADGKRVEHPWEQADEYFDKNDICRFVNKFFDKEIPGYWLNLAYGGGGSQDMWRAIIVKTGGSSIVSYAHQNLQSLCRILEKAFDERPDTPGDGIMLIVRTAIEDYFNED